jgi:hypothetical protein
MKVLFWNLYGLGRVGKLRAVGRLTDIHIIDVCFLLEIKIKTCTDSFIFRVWNNNNVNWAYNEAEGSRGGMIALWDDTNFQVSFVEYGYGWIGLYDQHMQSGFICAIVGVYAPCSMSENMGSSETCVSSNMPFLFHG